MYRISPQHLAWALENLVEGRVVNRIQVRAEREALGQSGAGPDAGSGVRAVSSEQWSVSVVGDSVAQLKAVRPSASVVD